MTTDRRHAVLTPADLEAIKEVVVCDKCPFTTEEVQFVKDWLDTAKLAKSEVVKWIVRIILMAIGIIAGIQVAAKAGYFKSAGK